MKFKNWLVILYISFWGGAIGVLSKFSFFLFSPSQLIFLRIIITLLIFSGFLFFRGKLKQSLALVIKHLAHFIFLSATGIFAAMFLGLIGLKFTTAINYDLLFNLSAAFLAILSFLFLHEHIKGRTWLLFAIALLGTFFIITNGQFELKTFQSAGFKGDLLIIVAAAGWGLYSILGTMARRHHPKLNPLLTVFGSFLIAAIILLPYIIIKEPFNFSKILSLSQLPFLAAALLLAIASTAILFLLWFYFLEKKGGLLTAFVALSENIAGVVLPIIFLGEQLTFWTAIGGLMIVLPLIVQDYLSNHKSQIINN